MYNKLCQHMKKYCENSVKIFVDGGHNGSHIEKKVKTDVVSIEPTFHDENPLTMHCRSGGIGNHTHTYTDD